MPSFVVLAGKNRFMICTFNNSAHTSQNSFSFCLFSPQRHSLPWERVSESVWKKGWCCCVRHITTTTDVHSEWNTCGFSPSSSFSISLLSLASFPFIPNWLTGGGKVFTLTRWRWNEGWRWRFTASERERAKIFFREEDFSFLLFIMCIPKYKHIPCLILQPLLVAPSLACSVSLSFTRYCMCHH